MSSISSIGPGYGPGAAATSLPSERTEAPPTVVESSSEARGEGRSDISLSPTGRILAASSGKSNAAGENDDIDNSGLPDSIKDVLKLIRKLQAELRQKQAEMAAVQANDRLNDEQKRARLQELQATIGVLSSAIMSAHGTLQKLMREQTLSTEQSMAVAGLLAKGG